MNNALILRDVGHLARDTRLVFELLDNLHGGMLEIRLPDGSSRLFGEGEHGVTLNVHDEAMFSQVLARGGRVESIAFEHERSTTALLRKIRSM